MVNVLILFISLSALLFAGATAISLSHARFHGASSGKSSKSPRRYAIAETWVVNPAQGVPNTRYEVENASCPLILSMKSAQAASRKAFSKEDESATIDLIIYTNMSSFGMKATKFLKQRGIRVMDVMGDSTVPILQRTYGGKSGFTQRMTNMLKLQFMWLTEYDAILALDWDVIFHGSAAGSKDLLGMAANGPKSIIGFNAPGAPIAGGVLAIRPSEEFKASFTRAMQHGFNYNEGFGGHYSSDMGSKIARFNQEFCSRPINGPCCTDPHVASTPNWCWAGVKADQGFLWHLAEDGMHHRSMNLGSGLSVGIFQPTLNPKPWQSNRLSEMILNDRIELLEDFWKIWENEASALLKDDKECTDYFDKQYRIFKECYNQALRKNTCVSPKVTT